MMNTETGVQISEQSRLGAHATRADRVGRSLLFSDELHLEAHRWLIEEAYTLDEQRYEQQNPPPLPVGKGREQP